MVAGNGQQPFKNQDASNACWMHDASRCIIVACWTLAERNRTKHTQGWLY